MAWYLITDKQRHSHKVSRSWWSPQDRPGVRREMETPRGKRQELQRNLGKQGGLEAIRHVGKGSPGQGWTARCEESPWAWQESFRQTFSMLEVARWGLGGYPTTGTQKKKIPKMLCWFLPRATQAKANASGRGRIETQLSWLPVQQPARRSWWYSHPAFKRKQQWNLLPWQLLEWQLLQEQTLCMQIKASRHNSLKEKN